FSHRRRAGGQSNAHGGRQAAADAAPHGIGQHTQGGSGMTALAFFAPLFRPHWRGLLLALVLSLVTLAAGTALLGVSGWFLTATALTALGVSFNLFAPSAAVRGFSFIRILARYFEKLVGHNAT